MSRSAASGHYQIVSLRPSEGESLQHRIEGRREAHERAVAEAISFYRRIGISMIELTRRDFPMRCTSATSKGTGRKMTMFKVLELKGGGSTPAMEVGRGSSTREQAMAAVKTHPEDIQGIRSQPGRRLLVGAGCRRSAKMLDFRYRSQNAVNGPCSISPIKAEFSTQRAAQCGSGVMTAPWSGRSS